MHKHIQLIRSFSTSTVPSLQAPRISITSHAPCTCCIVPASCAFRHFRTVIFGSRYCKPSHLTCNRSTECHLRRAKALDRLAVVVKFVWLIILNIMSTIFKIFVVTGQVSIGVIQAPGTANICSRHSIQCAGSTQELVVVAVSTKFVINQHFSVGKAASWQ